MDMISKRLKIAPYYFRLLVFSLVGLGFYMLVAPVEAWDYQEAQAARYMPVDSSKIDFQRPVYNLMQNKELEQPQAVPEQKAMASNTSQQADQVPGWLIEWITSDSGFKRAVAAFTLSFYGEEVVDPLLTVLDSTTNPQAQQAILDVLGGFANPYINVSPDVRSRVTQVLRDYGRIPQVITAGEIRSNPELSSQVDWWSYFLSIHVSADNNWQYMTWQRTPDSCELNVLSGPPSGTPPESLTLLEVYQNPSLAPWVDWYTVVQDSSFWNTMQLLEVKALYSMAVFYDYAGKYSLPIETNQVALSIRE